MRASKINMLPWKLLSPGVIFLRIIIQKLSKDGISVTIAELPLAVDQVAIPTAATVEGLIRHMAVTMAIEVVLHQAFVVLAI